MAHFAKICLIAASLSWFVFGTCHYVGCETICQRVLVLSWKVCEIEGYDHVEVEY